MKGLLEPGNDAPLLREVDPEQGAALGRRPGSHGERRRTGGAGTRNWNHRGGGAGKCVKGLAPRAGLEPATS